MTDSLALDLSISGKACTVCLQQDSIVFLIFYMVKTSFSSILLFKFEHFYITHHQIYFPSFWTHGLMGKNLIKCCYLTRFMLID